MRLTRSSLQEVDLESLRPYVTSASDFYGKSEHYRLLAQLSTMVPDKPIFDIGTHLGDSALALSYGGRAVESFDVVDKVSGRKYPKNVRFHRDDLFSAAGREKWKKKLLDSSIILIDVDPHEGSREYDLVCWLQVEGYRGLIVLDDIWYFKPMRENLWYKIEGRHKTDATLMGHWSGTGIVSFGERVECEGHVDTSNWTLVTGYFDLTKKADANDAIRARPLTHYIDQHASSTLSLDQNLLVFCEPELESKIWSMRPSYLHPRTRIVTMDFEDFPLTSRRDQIIKARGGPCCHADPRNTASYYLFCMARYAMLKGAIDNNLFKSTHFAWINICIERMGYQNLVHLDEALSVQRDKFSTCFIDYVPKRIVEDLPTYFGPKGCRTCGARCSMCSGFFTGNAKYMRDVCSKLENEFVRCLDAGFGHADEQLYPIVYYRNPSLFDWYCGDYTEMITNYAHVYEHPERPIANLIRNSLAAGDMEVCKRAAGIVWNSFVQGRCTLSAADQEILYRVNETC